MKFKIKNIVAGIKQRLSYLSFKTGVVIMLLCVVCYIVSFAQMMLSWSVATKGLVWTMFFGLAKTSIHSLAHTRSRRTEEVEKVVGSKKKGVR